MIYLEFFLFLMYLSESSTVRIQNTLYFFKLLSSVGIQLHREVMDDCYQILCQFFLECLISLFEFIQYLYLRIVFRKQVLEVVETESRQPVAKTDEHCLYIAGNDFVYQQIKFLPVLVHTRSNLFINSIHFYSV